MGARKLIDLFREKGWEMDREHSDGHAFTSPVGSFPRGASPRGALDMAGNVWQWCEDVYEEDGYARYARGETTFPRGQDRVMRGGSFLVPARITRTSNRGWNPPTGHNDTIGFRVVLRPS
jgi:formylglycine-generating enzyme required for sulfatase activity